MKLRVPAAFLGAVALVASCTGGPPEGPSGPQPSVDALPEPLGHDRLLVLLDDGSIVTVDRDGEGGSILRGETDLDLEARQPVWAPDGTSVAWVELSTAGPPASSTLVTSRLDGTGRTEIVLDTATFFLQWDPTSSRIAYLGSFQNAIGMGVADPAAEGGPSASTLGIGQPFYLSWAPEGDRLLIHVGSDTLGTVDLMGNLDPVGDRPGTFHAPVWLADDRFVYAVQEGSRQMLVVREGDAPRVLVRFRGAIEFVVSPDAERVAYRVDGADGLGPVVVVSLDAGRRRPVTDLPTTAFHWSPDGRRLLLMSLDEDDGDPGEHRWHVWNGRRTAPIGSTFLPSPTYLRDYLPFFGQFAQTMTLWSPDGRSFAFPGLIGDRAGIWVQDLDAEEPAFVVEDGSVVAWSPVGGSDAP